MSPTGSASRNKEVVSSRSKSNSSYHTSQKLLLDYNSLRDDIANDVGVRPPLEVAEEQTREVGVHALVARDELIREGETRHQAALLEPEDGREGAGEEDALDGSKGDETLREGRLLVRDPAECPVGLLLDARNGVDGIKEVLTLLGVLDIGIDEERVCLGVDVLHHDLEAVEAAGLGSLDLVGETLDEVFVDDAVRRGEEGKDMRDEVPLVVVETIVPVVEIL